MLVENVLKTITILIFTNLGFVLSTNEMNGSEELSQHLNNSSLKNGDLNIDEKNCDSIDIPKSTGAFYMPSTNYGYTGNAQYNTSNIDEKTNSTECKKIPNVIGVVPKGMHVQNINLAIVDNTDLQYIMDHTGLDEENCSRILVSFDEKKEFYELKDCVINNPTYIDINDLKKPVDKFEKDNGISFTPIYSKIIDSELIYSIYNNLRKHAMAFYVLGYSNENNHSLSAFVISDFIFNENGECANSSIIKKIRMYIYFITIYELHRIFDNLKPLKKKHHFTFQHSVINLKDFLRRSLKIFYVCDEFRAADQSSTDLKVHKRIIKGENVDCVSKDGCFYKRFLKVKETLKYLNAINEISINIGDKEILPLHSVDKILNLIYDEFFSE